jgi:proteasome lid subunit RPN8/RPN11
MLPGPVRRAIVAQALAERPLECCGLLVGVGTRIVAAAPMRNAAASAVRFRIDEREHLALRKLLRQLVPRLDIVGAYHSHPNGRAEPSATDIAQAFYPEWVHLIVGLRLRRPVVAGFRIRHGRAVSVELARPRDTSHTPGES